MNRFFLFALIWCIYSPFAHAQGVQLFNQVVSTTGTTGTQGNYLVFYTVGEPVVTTLTGTSNILTQGFHQPLLGLVSTYDTDLADWNIEVFPNPSEQFLNIRFAEDQTGGLELQVFDLLGRTVLTNQTLSASITRLDCASWQPGIYFLQLRSTDSAATATVRFIRI